MPGATNLSDAVLRDLRTVVRQVLNEERVSPDPQRGAKHVPGAIRFGVVETGGITAFSGTTFGTGQVKLDDITVVSGGTSTAATGTVIVDVLNRSTVAIDAGDVVGLDRRNVVVWRDCP